MESAHMDYEAIVYLRSKLVNVKLLLRYIFVQHVLTHVIYKPTLYVDLTCRHLGHGKVYS